MKNFWLAGLIIGITGIGYSQGMKYVAPQSVFQSEGRDPYLFNASCASGYWSVVVSSDAIARSTLMQAPSGNTAVVCLAISSTTASCSVSLVGPELAPNTALTDYTKSVWYCRSVSGSQNIKGYRTRDRGDFGGVSNLSL